MRYGTSLQSNNSDVIKVSECTCGQGLLRREYSDHLTMGREFPCTVQNNLTGVFSHTVWGRRATRKSGILGMSSNSSDLLLIMPWTCGAQRAIK